MDLLPERVTSNAVTLNTKNVRSGILNSVQKLLKNPHLCHKIIVEHQTDTSRNDIMNAILDCVYPYDFVPIHLTTMEGNSTFYVRNCKMAIEKLCIQNLQVPNLDGGKTLFQLTIIVAFCNRENIKVEVEQNINQVLLKQYNPSTKTLNLDRFYENPDLTEFCPLSQPKILNFVLDLSKKLNPEQIVLTNNNIRSLRRMTLLANCRSLKVLDLRDNKIASVEELNILKCTNVTELYLDGNPLCSGYYCYSYIAAIKEVCPTVIKLDDELLNHKRYYPVFHQNYLCNFEGKDLVDQFLEHYFTLYDSTKRYLLCDMYHAHAIFSFTCVYLSEKSTPEINLDLYQSLCQNMEIKNGLMKTNKYPFKGPKDIIGLFLKFPSTRHDPYSFTIDLMHYSDTSAVITVGGLFQEVTSSKNILSFTRTFILLKTTDDEYKIINEQLHISNPTAFKANLGFKFDSITKPTFSIGLPQDSNEQDMMVNAFHTITNLTSEWSKKILGATRYNFKQALLLFVTMYTKDKIPKIGFQPEQLQSPKTSGKWDNATIQNKREKILVYTGPNTFEYLSQTNALAQGLIEVDNIQTEIHRIPLDEKIANK